MLELARTAWAMVSLALVAVFVWALMVLPERVPQKLDAAWSVTEWSSKTTLLVGMVVGIATTVSLGPLARGISRTMSLDLVNVPHKDRWLPAHEGALRARVATDLYAVGASTGCLLAGIQAGMVAIALGEPRRLPDGRTAATGGGGYGCAMAATSTTARLSLDDRITLGRAAREHRPRASLATWRAPSYRANPVDLLSSQETDRVPVLLPLRHARTAASPFAFYRGSAIVMAADLGSMPTSGLMVQLSGDAHLSNFGVFRAPDRRLVFDGDDYDETLAGPFEWDVLRLATSFVLAGLAKSPTATSSSAARARASAGRKAALAAAATYRASMRDNASASELDLWYSREDETALRAWSRSEPRSNRLLGDLAAGKAGAAAATVRSAVEHFTTRVGGHRLFRDGPLLTRIGMDGALSESITRAVDAYRAGLAPDRAELVNRYGLVDIGHKVVGVGSVGLPDFVLLLQGRSRDDLLILQLKGAQPSALQAGLPSPATAAWTTDAGRVVHGARLSQADTDVFLGTADVPGAPSRYVRQLRDGKWAPDPTTLSPGRLVDFARMCGHSLARSHARTGDAVAIAAYLGRSTTFDVAVANFARRYADQVASDARDYRAAITKGRLTSGTSVDREALLAGLHATVG